MSNGRNRNSDWKRNRRKKSRIGFPDNKFPQCAYCGQSVRDVLTAIAAPDDEHPAHFDCVVRKIAEDEPLNPREKICYLGKGSFGIVKFRGGSNPLNFTIRKRIQIEPAEQEIGWRKSVANRLSPAPKESQ